MMRIQQRRSSQLLTTLFCVLQFVNFLGYVTQNRQMEGLFSLVSQGYILICTFAFIFWCIQYPSAFNGDLRMLLLVFMAADAVISWLLSGGIGAYRFALLLLAYLSLPMYLLWVPYVAQRRKTLRMVSFWGICTGLYFVYCFLFEPKYAFLTNALILGYSNQNRLAIYLVNNIALLLAAGSTMKRGSRFWVLALCFVESYMLYLTQARTAYICCAFLWFVYAARRSWKIKRPFVLLMMFLPMVFVAALLFVAGSGLISSDATLFGKSLFSGRESMFLWLLSGLRGISVLIGDFGQYQLGNLHNSFLSILCSLGVLGIAAFYLFFYFALMGIWRRIDRHPVRLMAFAGILILFMEGAAEAATLVSGAMYASAVTPMIYLTEYQRSEDDLV